jgi:hypothetical protein
MFQYASRVGNASRGVTNGGKKVKCRLKVNTISGGKFIERGSVIDDGVLPEHLKTEAYVAYDQGGEVMLLRDLNSTTTRLSDDGVATNFPEWRSVGEVVPKEKIPGDWREGEDYLSSWTPEQRREVQEKANAEYLAQFQREPESVPTGAPWRNR